MGGASTAPSRQAALRPCRGDRIGHAALDPGEAQEPAGLGPPACRVASRLDAQRRVGDLLRSNGIARRGGVAVVVEQGAALATRAAPAADRRRACRATPPGPESAAAGDRPRAGSPPGQSRGRRRPQPGTRAARPASACTAAPPRQAPTIPPATPHPSRPRPGPREAIGRPSGRPPIRARGTREPTRNAGGRGRRGPRAPTRSPRARRGGSPPDPRGDPDALGVRRLTDAVVQVKADQHQVGRNSGARSARSVASSIVPTFGPPPLITRTTRAGVAAWRWRSSAAGYVSYSST